MADKYIKQRFLKLSESQGDAPKQLNARNKVVQGMNEKLSKEIEVQCGVLIRNIGNKDS